MNQQNVAPFALVSWIPDSARDTFRLDWSCKHIARQPGSAPRHSEETFAAACAKARNLDWANFARRPQTPEIAGHVPCSCSEAVQAICVTTHRQKVFRWNKR